MLSKKEIETLRKISEREGTKGKDHIERFIWLNTVEPRFKKGDHVFVTDRNAYIGNRRVIDMAGVVAQVMFSSKIGDPFIQYNIRIEYIADGEHKIADVYAREESIKPATKADMKRYTIPEIKWENGRWISVN